MEEQVVQETMVDNQPQTPPPAIEKQALVENNLVAMRKKLEAEEKARKDLENRLAQAERNASQYKQPVVEDDDEDENAKKVRFLEERLNKMEVESVTTKLTNFSELVTDDNLATLQRLYPEDYDSIRFNPDVKARAKTAYNMIKNYGIATTSAKSNNEKIEENKKKPTAASLGAPQTPATPLSRLDEYGRRRLSDEERDRVMKDVYKKRRAS